MCLLKRRKNISTFINLLLYKKKNLLRTFENSFLWGKKKMKEIYFQNHNRIFKMFKIAKGWGIYCEDFIVITNL